MLSAQDIKKRFEKLKSERITWEDHWQEIADYMNPNRNNITSKVTAGSKRTVQILDSTSMTSSELLSGALAGLLTNPSTPWLAFSTGDRKLDAKPQVKKWLESSSNKTLDYINASNFQTEVHQFYLDITTLCTAGMYIEEDLEYMCRFSSQPINTLYIEENNKGLVSEVYRTFKWTARNIVAEFGEVKAFKFDVIKKHYEKNSDEKFEIIHAVYEKALNEQSLFKYHSQYILCHGYSNSQQELDAGGFNEFPYAVARWGKSSGEKYGRGPGMIALPEQKLLNKIVETTVKGAQKSVDPPMQAPDDGVVLPLKMSPGGITFVRSGSDPIKPIFDNYRVDFGVQVLESHRARIREAFYVDQLQLNSGPQMTATEVLQRTEEKMRLLGPLLGRQEFEFLVPLVTRVFGILQRRGVYDAPPAEIQGLKIIPKYISTISRSQKVGELNSILKGIQSVAPIAQMIPDVIDNFDSDGFWGEVVRIQSLPSSVVRTPDDVKSLREARKQGQQQAQQQIQQQQTVDNVAKLQKSQG